MLPYILSLNCTILYKTEIEVTEKRIDRVICEQLVEEFFSDMNRTPFFKLVPAGHVESKLLYKNLL